MESRQTVEERIHRVMYLLKLKRGAVINLVAEKNEVSRKTVYNWINWEKPADLARILYALEDIEKERSEQSCALEDVAL